MRIKNRKPYVPKNILWRIEDRKAVVFDELHGEPYLLNETGTTIWSHCVANKPIYEIIDQLQSEYNVDPQIIEKDVSSILAEFRKKGVVNFYNDT